MRKHDTLISIDISREKKSFCQEPFFFASQLIDYIPCHLSDKKKMSRNFSFENGIDLQLSFANDDVVDDDNIVVGAAVEQRDTMMALRLG